MPSATSRTTMSEAPPAAKPTSHRIGLAGELAAHAASAPQRQLVKVGWIGDDHVLVPGPRIFQLGAENMLPDGIQAPCAFSVGTVVVVPLEPAERRQLVSGFAALLDTHEAV